MDRWRAGAVDPVRTFARKERLEKLRVLELKHSDIDVYTEDPPCFLIFGPDSVGFRLC